MPGILMLLGGLLLSTPPTMAAKTAAQEVAAQEVHVYSARKETLLRPVLDMFEQQTGLRVKLLAGKGDALLQRLQLEGSLTQADLFLAVDAARLHRARERGLLQTVTSSTLEASVPKFLRDAQGYWYGLTLRARVIAYHPKRVKMPTLASYAILAEPGQRLCLRSSDNTYNQSLVAGLLRHWGAPRTKDWIHGMMQNLVRPPQGGDRDQIRAIAAGVCDFSLVNTYYHARMLHVGTEAERKIASQVALDWPHAPGGGTHVNISGAGITRHASNREGALRLLEFLVGQPAQRWFVEKNYEHPVRAELPGPEGSGWFLFLRGTPVDFDALQELGANHAAAVRLMDEAGWR